MGYLLTRRHAQFLLEVLVILNRAVRSPCKGWLPTALIVPSPLLRRRFDDLVPTAMATRFLLRVIPLFVSGVWAQFDMAQCLTGWEWVRSDIRFFLRYPCGSSERFRWTRRIEIPLTRTRVWLAP